MHWRDRYEYESSQEYERLLELGEEALVSMVENDRLGLYFAIWRVLARKGTLTRAAMPLWEYLQRSPGKSNMLNRYHCAAALFKILGMPDPASENELRKRVQWDHQGEEARQHALTELRKLIERKIKEQS